MDAAAVALLDGDGALRRGMSSTSAASHAREDAAEILSGREYRGTDLPDPLRSPLERLTDLAQDAFASFDAALPGGPAVAWLVIGLAIVLVAAAVASRWARRHEAAEQRRVVAGRVERQDPRALLAEAEDAERAGELERAIRLRFRAGLLDLHLRDVVALRSATPNAEISRKLRSPTFDGLATTFDAVAYGGREPAPGDVATAREDWPKVRIEAAAR